MAPPAEAAEAALSRAEIARLRAEAERLAEEERRAAAEEERLRREKERRRRLAEDADERRRAEEGHAMVLRLVERPARPRNHAEIARRCRRRRRDLHPF